MITFTHFGQTGDVILSLWFVKEYCQAKNQKCIFHLQTNVKIKKPSWIDQTHFNSTTYLSRQSAEFLKPLLQKCDFIDQVMIGDERPVGAINLNEFRDEGINVYGGDLRDNYYQFNELALPREYWKPVLDVEPSDQFKDKILFTLTERYVNRAINYVKLKKFEDRIVFMGTEKEYKRFCEMEWKVKQLITPKTLLEAAQWMKGSKGFISNQNGFFALAEALKVPRILFPPDWMQQPNCQIIPGPKNNLPLGGRCASISKYPIIQATVEKLFSLQE